MNSPEHVYQQVLLFSHEAKEKMNEGDIQRLFWAKDDQPQLNDDGDMMTVVKRLRR